MPIRRIPPRSRVHLARHDPADTNGYDEETARSTLERDVKRLAELQDALYAERKHAVLVVLQGMDTSGKDGTVKHVMSGVNPSGCAVVPFKVPTEEEAAHDFLWRVHRATPRLGHITIFNRSHYEDVIVPRVHRILPKAVLAPRYDHINAFERTLAENGTVILKFFLHIGKREQRERLLARLSDPRKRWKFDENDLKERALWGRYMRTYEKLLERCSTQYAPWYVVPADRKWYRNLAVASVLVDAIRRLRCRYPEPVIPPSRLKSLRL